MKKIFIISVFFLISFCVSAQDIKFNCDSASYYNNIPAGLGSIDLKTALFNLIKNHTHITYAQLWTAFQTTDTKPDSTVWDIYSDVPGGPLTYEYTFITDQCSSNSPTIEAQCYNREHSFPQDWFGQGILPMYSDLFHIYPTDGLVNHERGNLPYGDVMNPSWTSLNGSKIGLCIDSGYSQTVFEPIDEYKGDLARSFFYMATRYENLIAGWEILNLNETGDDVLDGTSWPCYESWFVSVLCAWNTQDPVSRKERDRNNAICAIQGNRNPFIDHPEWVWEIWNCPGVGVEQLNTDLLHVTVFPNPVSEILTVKPNDLNSIIDKIEIYSYTSSLLQRIDKPTGDLTIDVSGLAEGFYALVIYSGEKVSRKKVVVIH